MQTVLKRETTPLMAHERGYFIVYREQEVNHCPGCGRTQWYIGRTMAECAFCTTALPLEAASGTSQSAKIVRLDRQNHAAARGRYIVNQKIC